jgi:hypothetical protein
MNLENIKFEKIYRILSMKRSGHHAIMDWLANNMEYNVYLKNNITVEKNTIRKLNEHKYSKNILFYNIEDYDHNQHNNVYLENLNIQKENHQNLIIIRDPLNLFASRIKRNTNRIFFNDYFLSLYQQHFNLMKSMDYINYNQWLHDKNYLLKLKKEFNLFDIKKINKISKFGIGSSFDGFNKNPEEMDFNMRWKSLNDEDLKKIKKSLDLEILNFFDC